MNNTYAIIDNEDGKCILQKNNKPCRLKKIEGQDYCNNHTRFGNYSAEQLANVTLCKKCGQDVYKTGKTCDSCIQRAKIQRQNLNTKVYNTEGTGKTQCTNCKLLRTDDMFISKNGRITNSCQKCKDKFKTAGIKRRANKA